MMEENPKTRLADLELHRLEQKVEDMIRLCARLREENRTLRTQQEHLVSERAALIEKNEIARNRVEAMLTRLKSLETGS